MLQPASEYGLSSAESAKPLVFFFKKSTITFPETELQ